MKSFIISVLISFTCTCAFAQYQTGGTLRAVVNGDTAVLQDDSCWRNCGAHYEMIVTLSGNHLVWLQHDLAGGAFCDCPIDLAVTVAHLEPGNYISDVYFTTCYSQDTIYAGSLSFLIPDVTEPGTINIYNPYQSVCLFLNTEDQHGTPEVLSSASPNPFKEQSLIRFDNRVRERNQLLIFNSWGILVRKFDLPANTQGVITWDGRNSSGLRLAPGTYLYSTQTGNVNLRNKIILIE
ncbi:MAG: hypothetical protein NT040_16110 [Bacteroidetes bacterium]|nr:hypothetical protein [Bacteroidota bacterium]